MVVSFLGTSFLVIGAAIVGDLYEPTSRGNTPSWMLFGSLIGQATGPLIGGTIVTYQSWRVIFGLQAGLAAVAFVLAFFFLPETIPYRRSIELENRKFCQYISKVSKWTSPF